MPRPVIGNAEARRLLLAAQGLSRPRNRKLTAGGLLDLVTQLAKDGAGLELLAISEASQRYHAGC